MTKAEEKAICGRIKLARKGSGITQRKMADLLSVELRTYQNYEQDRVPWSQLGEIARATNTTWDWLMHGDEQTVLSELAALREDVADLLDRQVAMGVILSELLGETAPGRAAEAAKVASAKSRERRSSSPRTRASKG